MNDEKKVKIEGLKAELKSVQSELKRHITGGLLDKEKLLKSEIATLCKPEVAESNSDSKEMLEKLCEKVDEQQKTIDSQKEEIDALNLKIIEIEKKKKKG